MGGETEDEIVKQTSVVFFFPVVILFKMHPLLKYVSCIRPSETGSYHTTQKPLVSLTVTPYQEHPQSNVPVRKAMRRL